MKNKANRVSIVFIVITIITFAIFSGCAKKNIKNTDITNTQATTQPSTDTQNNSSQRIENTTHSEQQNNNQTSSINNTKSTIQSDRHISSSSQTSVQSIANAIKKSTQNYLGEGEKITKVTLNDRILTVYVDLSKADTSILPIHEIAYSRIDGITSKILELDEYYSL